MTRRSVAADEAVFRVPTSFAGANLYFSTSYDSWTQPAAVGFYSTANPLQPSLTGWLPSSEFSY